MSSAPPSSLTRTPLRDSHGKITLVMYNEPTWCGGKCSYCFVATGGGFTRSTSKNEDTSLARNCNWDARCQIEGRFREYGIAGKRGLKCSLAVKGDSFTTHSMDYLELFTKGALDFLNADVADSLADALAMQADAPNRCVTYNVETRPDYINEEWCDRLARLGVTTVELGVQSLDEGILAANRRGHDVECIARATSLLRDAGFDITYQVMVGLPASTVEDDLTMLASTLWRDEFCPDALKIYPCILLRREVARHIGLEAWFNDGRWVPYNTDRYIGLLREAYPDMPRFAHVNRIQRIFEPDKIAAGPAQVIDRHIFDDVSRCLWQRSVAQRKDRLNDDFTDFRVVETAQGRDLCFEAVLNDDTVIGYARLGGLRGNDAVIRDVRALGNMVAVGVSANGRGAQHIGVGSKLIEAMERAARRLGCKKIVVRPAPGTRRYFERRGYVEETGFRLEKTLQVRHNPKPTSITVPDYGVTCNNP